jgi:hypothetical protein
VLSVCVDVKKVLVVSVDRNDKMLVKITILVKFSAFISFYNIDTI